MKIRTDFVTNSSSSSYAAALTITDVHDKEYKLSMSDSDHDWEGFYSISLGDKVFGKNLAELLESIYVEYQRDYDDLYDDFCNDVSQLYYALEESGQLHLLIDDGAEHSEDEYMDALDNLAQNDEEKYEALFESVVLKALKEETDSYINRELESYKGKVTSALSDISQVRKVRVSNTLYTYGESASCFLINHKTLENYAKAVMEAAPEEKDTAVEVMKCYLEWPEGGIYAEGGWGDEISANRFAWHGSVENLAQEIVDGRIGPDDTVEDYTEYDFTTKTVSTDSLYWL